MVCAAYAEKLYAIKQNIVSEIGDIDSIDTLNDYNIDDRYAELLGVL